MRRLTFAAPVWLLACIPASAGPPQSLDDRISIELFAEHPDIVTPTGVTVDAAGRVLVIESHTHFRPDNYDGPPADRIREFTDTDGDGRADRIETFFSGTRATMSLAVYHDGSVYVATRNEIFRLRDTDGDRSADTRTPIARLETDGNYPHNGLSGFTFDHRGRVYFGFGENLGFDYTLRGADGAKLSGGGEGGNIYRCEPDGSQLALLATGFWNPFDVGFDAYGRLFTVDNDPDSRPPCRLLHVVPGGDYGYRFRNGRKGLHPFTAWNGELPGTLPMVAGTGEAPSGVIAYESDGLPADYRGRLLVTSWGDHRIESYELEPRGASFRAVARPVIVGDEDFRPVGIALVPDGSLYVTDWVKKDYELHGHGRVWRIRARRPANPTRPAEARPAIASTHLPLRQQAARELASSPSGREFLRDQVYKADDPRVRAAALAALSVSDDRELDYGRALNSDPSDAVRAMAVRMAPVEALDFRQIAGHDRSPEVRAAALGRLSTAADVPHLLAALADADPFIRQAARSALLDLDRGLLSTLDWQPGDARLRLEILLLARHVGGDFALRLLPEYLDDPDADVRFAAVQWVGEEGIETHRGALVAGLTTGATTPRLFAGYLAALERLDSAHLRAGDERSPQDYVARLLLDEAADWPVRRRALRILPPDHPELTVERLVAFAHAPDAAMQQEAVFALCDSPHNDAAGAVEEIARDATQPISMRAAALNGVVADSPERVQFLLSLLAPGEDLVLAREALRSLRGAVLNDLERAELQAIVASSEDDENRALAAFVLEGRNAASTPASQDIDAWLSLLSGEGDAAAGQRVFFHPRGPGCAKCHHVDGRGAAVGPDLSSTARQLTRRRLIESIMLPSREIAPQFVPWSIETTDGRPLVGMLLGESPTGEQTYLDSQGVTFIFPRTAVAARTQHTTSIMPDNLHHQMTPGEFRDLLAYLKSPR